MRSVCCQGAGQQRDDEDVAYVAIRRLTGTDHAIAMIATDLGFDDTTAFIEPFGAGRAVRPERIAAAHGSADPAGSPRKTRCVRYLPS